jgi:hypothetical protein
MRPVIRIAVACLPALAACSSSSQPQPQALTRNDLLDPQSCQGCHADQFGEWAGSMHAYASKDPVFLAMNKRGQRETSGQLGKFCVNCHAPMAVHEGATTDGLNLDQLPDKLKGITCYFCHSIEAVTGTHDNPLTLANDGLLRAALSNPLASGRPHGAAYSPLLDRNRIESASTCGACHDIVNGHGTAIERTLTEWKTSAFANVTGTTCSQCHMAQSTTDKPAAQVPGAPMRRPHSHTFPAIDAALTPFPDTQRQHDQIQTLLDSTLQTAICVQQFGAQGQVSVIIDNVAAGHGFPSGSEQDRRAWVELIAYRGGSVIYQSGVVPDGEPSTKPAAPDPDRWLMRDCMFDDQNREVHMFWQAFSFQTNGLPPLTTFDVSSPDFYQTHKYRYFPPSGATIPMPDRITMRVRLERVGLEVVDDLIASGDLDPKVRGALTTLQAGGQLEWTPAAASTYIDRATGNRVLCATSTNLNVQADKFPAATRTSCQP